MQLNNKQKDPPNPSAQKEPQCQETHRAMGKVEYVSKKKSKISAVFFDEN